MYLAKWPNGDFSIVAAPTKDEALYVLDETGDPSAVELILLDSDSNVLINFKKSTPTEANSDLFVLEDFGEDLMDVFSDNGIILSADGTELPEIVEAA